jgi:capsular polysaccharide biosynthesis protein
MTSRDEGEGDRRQRGAGLLLAISAWLYGVLLLLYPKAFRRRYAREMRRDFQELSREGLEEGGRVELVRVWTSTLSDLALTALKERGTVLTRNAYLPVEPRIVARVMAAIVLVTMTVSIASLAKTPQYEASTMILIGQEKDSQQPSGLSAQDEGLQEVTMTLAEATRTRPVAEATIERLGLHMTPDEFLERLDAKTVDNTQFIEVSYTDTDPMRAQVVANTVGDVLSKEVRVASPGANSMIATLWERAPVPKEPVSPNPLRNGVVAMITGLMLSVALAFALPSVAASGIGRVTVRASRAMIVRPASTSSARITRAPATEAAKEKALLEALRRCGALTVAGAALETSLTVEEVDRMLSTLAVKGHLEVRVERGRLLYSLWEGDTPL